MSLRTIIASFGVATAYLILSLLSSSNILVAQTSTVKRIQSSDGLSSDAPRHIHEDKYGYKWISTGHGLNKYDGYSFEIFRADPLDSFSIRANSLGKIFEDNHANIWVTIDIGGMAKLDRATGQFAYYYYNSKDPAAANNFITYAYFDSQDRGWASSASGINLIDHEHKTFSPIPVDGYDQLNVFKIFETDDGQLWLGANEGLFVLDSDQSTFKEVLFNNSSITEAFRFLELESGSLWINSFRKGLYTVNTADLTVSEEKFPDDSFNLVNNVFSADGGIMISVPAKGLFKKTKKGWEELLIDGLRSSDIRVASSTVDRQKIVTFTMDNNLVLIDPELKTSINIMAPPGPVTSYWLDKDELNLWVAGQFSGLFQASIKNESFQEVSKKGSSHGFPMNTITQTKEGGVYYSSGNDLVKILPDEKVAPIKLKLKMLGFDFQINYLLDYENKLLLATTNGIYTFDKSSLVITPLNGLSREFSFHTLTLDKAGALWAIGSAGLVKYDFIRKKSLYFTNLNETPALFKNTQARHVFIDSNEDIWVGTVREGMFKITETAGGYDFRQYIYTGVRNSEFQSQTINLVFEDRNSNFWVGGFSTGLLLFDRDTEQWTNMAAKGSLPIPNVQSILEASDGCLWLSAINGIHKFIPKDRTFKHFGFEDGLNNVSYRLQASTKDELDNFYFGHTSGLTYFNANSIKSEIESPDILIEQVRLFDHSIREVVPPQEIKELEFPYHQNFIGLDFISINFSQPDRTLYSYQMVGVDEDWVNNGTSRSVNYANLSPGEYIFKVRAARNQGNWSDQVASITIRILPPFWQKWWFYVSTALLIAGILFSLHQLRLKRKLQRLSFMEGIRKKAAADFHDEMGNKLTRIALFSEVLERKLNGSHPETSEYVEKIKSNSRSLNNSMRDFLWALDPKRDSAYDLASMLKDFGEDLFDKTTIAFSVDQIQPELHDITLTMDWKRHLVMTFKEAMHNALKHSKAKNVFLNFKWSNESFCIALRDDGKGFDLDRASKGYGLRNMKLRIAEVKGELNIESQAGIGTNIIFKGNPPVGKKTVIYE